MESITFKICVWMNIPSHYQTAFYEALAQRSDVDLKVCYFNGVSATRVAEGWEDSYELKTYEVGCEGASTPEEFVDRVPDWKDRIHLISAAFNASLVNYFCASGVRWCHWSEMPGVRLADLLGYHMGLFRLLNPLMLGLKRREGARIRKSALGVLGQGRLARDAFKRMGVPRQMMADLYYAPAALQPGEQCNDIRVFSGGRKVFLCVGALCQRKGTDIMLKAFARLKEPGWCVVFCGLDKENGKYEKLADQLGIGSQILFLGAWPRERIAEVYAAADVFVLPSRFDGWGAVLNEAASIGLPIIGTDLCGGSWHVIQPDRNGCRARAGSVSSLAESLKRYIAKPEVMKAHGEASVRIYSEELSPAANAERLVRTLGKWGNCEG